MKEVRLIMGMPITIDIVDASATARDLDVVFDYFTYIDNTFSTYKPESEMMQINAGTLPEKSWSDDMHIIFMLAQETKQRTHGFFDIKKPDGSYDPSGIVKGWAIQNAAHILDARGFKNYYLDVGGDIQVSGHNAENTSWRIGIKNPLNQKESVKTIVVPEAVGSTPRLGVATSGTYIRGDHIYNPKTGTPANDIVSLTVVGPSIYDADRFATAAFAMGVDGIHFIETLPGFEGYMINKVGVATMTTGFSSYTPYL
jgi:thiamine biosynthesis lipoprotein